MAFVELMYRMNKMNALLLYMVLLKNTCQMLIIIRFYNHQNPKDKIYLLFFMKDYHNQEVKSIFLVIIVDKTIELIISKVI